MDELEALAAQRVGTRVGRWTIERVLGTGGMASVLFGRAPDGTGAAIKILHPEVNREEELRKRFLREGSIGNLLGTPGAGGADEVTEGFVRVIESGEADDGSAYLAMEALEGESLFDKITRERTMDPADVLALAEQVLDVLVVAHARGIVHRDLKPENLHVLPDGRVKVLDFGIARVIDAMRGGDAAGALALPEKTATKTGVIMGTAAYMAPEQATGLVKEIDERTDVFALGATMFRLLAGRTVHGPLTDTQEVIAAATEPPRPLAQVAGGISPDIAAVVDRALAFLKPHRYPDAVTMRDDVRALRAGKRPPYAIAVLDGRIAPGAKLQPASAGQAVGAHADGGAAPPSRVAPTVVGDAAAGRVATTAPDAARPAPTQVDRPGGAARTVSDRVSPNVRTALVVVGALALLAGIGVGVGVATCGGSDDETEEAPAPPARADAGKATPSVRPRLRLPPRR